MLVRDLGARSQRSSNLRDIPINRFSKKARAKQSERKALLKRVVEGKPCKAVWDYRCTGRATDGHEIKSRARGGSILDDANVMPVCRYCHMMITTHPLEAHERGFLKHAWEN